MAVDPQHLQRLVSRVKHRHAEIEQEETKQKAITERERLINSVPDITITEFYCSCHGDFVAPAGKITFTDSYGELCAYYVSHGTGYLVGDTPSDTFKVCRRKRFITDKHLDPYYRQSPMLRKARIMLADDLLQPDDPRYKAKYGDPFKQFYEQQEAKAKADWQAQRQRN